MPLSFENTDYRNAPSKSKPIEGKEIFAIWELYYLFIAITNHFDDK